MPSPSQHRVPRGTYRDEPEQAGKEVGGLLGETVPAGASGNATRGAQALPRTPAPLGCQVQIQALKPAH